MQDLYSTDPTPGNMPRSCRFIQLPPGNMRQILQISMYASNLSALKDLDHDLWESIDNLIDGLFEVSVLGSRL